MGLVGERRVRRAVRRGQGRRLQLPRQVLSKHHIKVKGDAPGAWLKMPNLDLRPQHMALRA